MIIDVNKPMTIDTHDIKILDIPLKKEWYDMRRTEKIIEQLSKED